MRIMLIVATLVAALPTCALAQSVPTDRLFNGPFVGAQGGWGRRKVDQFTVDGKKSGFDYGAFAGADVTIARRFVIGAEGDIGGGGRTISRAVAGVGPISFDPGRNWSVSGRAGILVAPDILVYGRVGYGEERLRATFTNSTPSMARTRPDGTMIGSGIEYALVRHVSLRAEYRYSDFDGHYNPRQLLIGAAFRF